MITLNLFQILKHYNCNMSLDTFPNNVNCVSDFGVQAVRLGMFEVQSHKLIHSLVKLAQELQQKLITRMLQDHQEINNKSVGSLFSCLNTEQPEISLSATIDTFLKAAELSHFTFD